jgi:UDP-glucose 4-epimerase
VFNVGTGNGYSVLEIIKTFERVTGVKVNYKIVDRRPGDIEIVWADSTKANTILGWKAKHGLDEMLLSAWNWEKSLNP